jgi:hypothetical protein
MTIHIKKVLKIRQRGKEQWEPPMEIRAFKEDGTDLVIFDEHSNEIARYPANKYDSWVVEGHTWID